MITHALFRSTFDLSGVVQGVGFRPAVYRFAGDRFQIRYRKIP